MGGGRTGAETSLGKLNPKQVENTSEPGTYEDGDGLRLVVKTGARKSWIIRFQLNGRRRKMGLGSYPEISLKQARLEAKSKRALLASGIGSRTVCSLPVRGVAVTPVKKPS